MHTFMVSPLVSVKWPYQRNAGGCKESQLSQASKQKLLKVSQFWIRNKEWRINERRLYLWITNKNRRYIFAMFAQGNKWLELSRLLWMVYCLCYLLYFKHLVLKESLLHLQLVNFTTIWQIYSYHNIKHKHHWRLMKQNSQLFKPYKHHLWLWLSNALNFRRSAEFNPSQCFCFFST